MNFDKIFEIMGEYDYDIKYESPDNNTIVFQKRIDKIENKPVNEIYATVTRRGKNVEVQLTYWVNDVRTLKLQSCTFNLKDTFPKTNELELHEKTVIKYALVFDKVIEEE